MKEEITRCYNLVADLLNVDHTKEAHNRKLNEVYEILTGLVLEMEK